MNSSPVTNQTSAQRLPCLMLAFAIVAATAYVIATSGGLPETVATHFDGLGRPNGWMTQDGYRIFMLAFTIMLPLFVTAAIGWLPRRIPRWTNIPNRDYWFAPERRDAAFAYLTRLGCVLGCLIAAFSAALHGLILDAQTRHPPRLDHVLLGWMMAVFLIGLTVWTIVLLRRFARPRTK